MVETELKFILEPRHAPAIDAALRRLGARATTLVAHYFDTPDRRLARAGLSLRLRRRGRAWEQTLKAPSRGPSQRLEDTVARPGRAAATPAIDPGLHAGGAAGRALREALRRGDPAGAALQAVHCSRIVRRSVEIELGGARIEVSLDRGSIRAGDAVAPVCEVEYELESGPATALLAPARAGVRAYAMRLCTRSKAARGERLGDGAGRARALKARAPEIDADMSGPVLLRAVVAACLEQILGNASAVALDDLDDEIVHQLRVGVRRLRTATRELGGLDAALPRAWEAPLGDAFRALGRYRDRVSIVPALERRLADAGSPSPRLGESSEAAPEPAAIVAGGAFQLALLDLVGLVLEPVRDAGVAIAAGDVRALVEARLDELQRHLARGAKRFEKLSDADRHRARKRLKRLRYLAELVAPLYKARRVERYLGALAPAQDALGDYIDLVVGADLAQGDVRGGDTAAWFNAGWFAAERQEQARRCRRALVRAARARPFWVR